MKQRYLREADELSDAEAVVVRGGDLDREILRADALRNQAIYGSFGIGVDRLCNCENRVMVNPYHEG